MRAEPALAEAPPEVSAPLRPARPARLTLNVEALAWAVVLAVAAAWRLSGLGAAPPATTEALRARSAWEFAGGTVPAAWPGDLASALAALSIRAGGDGIGWVRLGPALFGLGCVAALALLRPYAGRAAVLLGALMLAASPVAVASARTLNPDSAGLLCGLLIVWLALRIGEDGDTRALPLLGAVAGIALTTSAVAVALGLIACAWVGVEVAWLDREGPARRWRQALRDRRLVGAATLFALPGLALGVIRFGAGPDRLSLAAFGDWAGPPPDAGAVLPWHAPLAVLVGYEPPALVLGVAGALLAGARWRRNGAMAVTPFERLLLVWTGGALCMTLGALHHRPGQVLLLALSLMLLAARLTVQALPSLAAFRWRESGLVLLPAGLILGYVALQFLAWAHLGVIARNGALGVIVLLAMCAGLVGWALKASPPAMPGMLVAAAWLLLGWLAPHGATAAAHRNGNEILAGQRPLPQQAALVRALNPALDDGRDVAVERSLAAALAWELRGRGVRLYTGLPPRSELLVRRVDPTAPAGYVPAGPPAAVEERWYPAGWNAIGAVRWLLYRERWGPAQTLAGEVLQPAP